MMKSVILLLLAAAGELSLTVASEYIGCYKDTAENHDLKLHVEYKLMNNTPTVCIQYCVGQRYEYAAVQNGNECFCGSYYGSHGTSNGCNKPCTGDSSIICGGYYANSVYITGYELAAVRFLGCFIDSMNDRDLNVKLSNDDKNTPNGCTKRCSQQGYPYASVQFGVECFCGSRIGRYGLSTGCNMACAGNSKLICGGSLANSVYTTGVGKYIGCYKDQQDRDLTDFLPNDLTSNTPSGCVKRCIAKGFAYASVQYGNECHCGTTHGRYGLSTNCNMACAGDSNLICGGEWANSVYTTGI